MSYKKVEIIPVNPATTRGIATKLSASKDKIVYTNGRTVVIRDLKNTSVVLAYSGHVKNTTVARISPSGYYCASADVGGGVRIWDAVGEGQILKAEYQVLGGRINDLDWDGESKRIVVGGESRDKFGHAFMVDTGSSTGEIMGHSKAINAVAIRHQRPFRAATAGEDASIIFHQGVPFKYDKTIKTHTKYVQDIKYAPSGDHFASVGSDFKIFVYDGKTGDTLSEFTDSPHTGSITATSWSFDNKSLVTSAADRTVKLWDVEMKKAVTTWTVGSEVKDQQMGIVWTPGDDIVSVSLSGDLNVFDKRSGGKPARVLYAPTKPITAGTAVSPDTFTVGAGDGRILSFDSTGYSDVDGETHSTLVTGVTADPHGVVYTVGYDDRVRELEPGAKRFVQASHPTASQPKSIAVGPDSTLFVAEINGVEAVRSNQKVFELNPKFRPNSVAVSGPTVAVGGDDHKVHLYSWDGKTLQEKTVLEGNAGVVTAIAFNPDGTLLASGDSSGKVILFDAKEHKLVHNRWSFHSGRINSLAWTADGKNCASGSLDTHVYVWSVAKPLRNIAIKQAGPGGVNTVFWLSDTKLASAGADGCVWTWDVTFHV